MALELVERGNLDGTIRGLEEAVLVYQGRDDVLRAESNNFDAAILHEVEGLCAAVAATHEASSLAESMASVLADVGDPHLVTAMRSIVSLVEDTGCRVERTRSRLVQMLACGAAGARGLGELGPDLALRDPAV